MSLLNTICSQLHKSIWVTFINSNKLASPPLKFFSFFSLNTIHKANRNMIKPWPQSPNMTAKRNGNVMMVNRAVCRKKVKKKKKQLNLFAKIEWKVTYIDILKVLYIFPGWLRYFKGLFIPVWHEIHQSKFYMWHHDNWPIAQWIIFHTAPDTAYVNHFSPACIYNMIQIHSGETSQPRDFVASSIPARSRALKLASLTFKNLVLRGWLEASLLLTV